MAHDLTIGVDARHLLAYNPSGVPLATRSLLAAMVRGADEDRVRFKLFANAATVHDAIHKDITDRSNVEVLNPRIPNRLLNASVFLSGYPPIDSFLGDVDVVWSPNVLFLGVSKQMRLALTVHDLSFLLLPETYSLKRRLWHRAVKATALMRRADRLFAVSEATKRDIMSQLQISEHKIKVTPHGVPVLAQKEKMPEAWMIPSDTPFVLFLATIEPRKNVLALLRAYEKMIEERGLPHHLVLAGGWGWKPQELRDALQKSPLRDRIHVTGYVSEEEKLWLLKRASALAFPSLYEGFGLPPLEAFQVDLPVLASSTSSVAETVGDAAVLVNPYDVGEMSFGLGELLEDVSLQGRLIARGHERLSLFSWDRSAKIMLESFIID